MKSYILLPLVVNPLLNVDINQPPDIQVRCDTEKVEDQLVLSKDCILSVDIEDSDFDRAYFDIDGLQTSLDQKGEVEVQKNNRILTIVAFDKAGNESMKTIRFTPLEIPKLSASVNQDAYITSPNIDFSLDSMNLEDWDLVVSLDGKKDVMEVKEHLELTRSGKYEMYYAYKKDPSITSNHLSFHFTNEKPSCLIVPSATESSQDVLLQASWNGMKITKKTCIIRSDHREEILPLEAEYLLKGEAGQDLTYEIEGVVEDAFGQSNSYHTTVRIDKKAPTISLLKNGKVIPNNHFTVRKSDQYEIQSDGSLQISYLMNQLPLSCQSMEEAFQLLQQGDTLTIRANSFDDLGNQTSLSWTCEKAQAALPTISHTKIAAETENDSQAKLEPTIQSSLLSGQVLSNRTWSLDQNQQVHLEKKDQALPRYFKPRLSIQSSRQGKKNKIRVVLYRSKDGKEKFSYIRINKKKISLSDCKKDQFGNLYYEFTSKKTCLIQAKARNAQGNTKVVKKKILKQKAEQPLGWLEQILWKLKHA